MPMQVNLLLRSVKLMENPRKNIGIKKDEVSLFTLTSSF